MPRSTAAPDPEFGWCPTCKRRREVAERSSEYVQEYAGQRGVIVTRFECGHEDVHEDGWFAPFP